MTMEMSMKCDNVKDIIPFLDDGSVESETADNVRKHLEKCPACQKEHQEISDLVNGVRKVLLANELAPTTEYLGIVRGKIGKKKKTRALPYRLVSAAAVIVFTVSLILYIFINRETTDSISE